MERAHRTSVFLECVCGALYKDGLDIGAKSGLGIKDIVGLQATRERKECRLALRYCRRKAGCEKRRCRIVFCLKGSLDKYRICVVSTCAWTARRRALSGAIQSTICANESRGLFSGEGSGLSSPQGALQWSRAHANRDLVDQDPERRRRNREGERERERDYFCLCVGKRGVL